MAQELKILLIDDLDGGEADETVRFGLDGVQYEIDLSKTHAKELRSALSNYVSGARRSAPVKARVATPGRNPEPALVREWARANGYNVSTRGRVNTVIVQAYRAAQR
ncbi:histone-like nucleoid-structuring protein Lsr2 [Arthrobacter sp. TMN-50]